jgi:hypothetical protein
MKSTENYKSHSSFLFLIGTVRVYRVQRTVHRLDRLRIERHMHLA